MSIEAGGGEVRRRSVYTSGREPEHCGHLIVTEVKPLHHLVHGGAGFQILKHY
jgi:hypothetical protein